jgi:membrane protein
VLWLRVYVANFGTYDVMYGAIGGVILLLLWLFLTSVVLLIGAEVNKVISDAAAHPPGPALASVCEPAPDPDVAQRHPVRRSA